VSEPEDGGAARWPAESLERLGLSPTELHSGSGARLAAIRRLAPIDDRWPRAVGIPAKRPLW
jgi:hypothetical protein